MGYRMALNLRKKIPASDHLLIQDVNPTALKDFMQETGGHGTRIAKDARQVAEESVSLVAPLSLVHFHIVPRPSCWARQT